MRFEFFQGNSPLNLPWYGDALVLGVLVGVVVGLGRLVVRRWLGVPRVPAIPTSHSLEVPEPSPERAARPAEPGLPAAQGGDLGVVLGAGTPDLGPLPPVSELEPADNVYQLSAEELAPPLDPMAAGVVAGSSRGGPDRDDGSA